MSMKTKLDVYVNMNQGSIVDRSSMELRIISKFCSMAMQIGVADTQRSIISSWWKMKKLGKVKQLIWIWTRIVQDQSNDRNAKRRSKNLLKALVSNQHRSIQITRK